MSANAVQKRSSREGLTRSRGSWEPSDNRFLLSHAVEWSIERLAAHFERSPMAVKKQLVRLGVKVSDTRYDLTATDVARMLLVDESTVRKWIRQGILGAYHNRPARSPHRVPPRFLRRFILAERRGIVDVIPVDLLELMATANVPIAWDITVDRCAELTLARAHEVERWIDRKWLLRQGASDAEPVRAKDLKTFAVNQPEHVPALRRVPVETVQLIADLWG